MKCLHELQGIIQADAHPLFDKKGMYRRDIHSDLKEVHYISRIIVRKAPSGIHETDLLEKRISEILKNAVGPGNGNDPNKKVKIWYAFDEKTARLIVEDEGEGFREVEHWNQFYRKRIEAFESQDLKEMMKHLSYRSRVNAEDDFGNALLDAVDFWNGGIVFNQRGNAVAVKRVYE